MNKISMAVIAALLATSASAMEFQTLGYKSVSMGGAAVASSSASLATYNNPALLAKPASNNEVSLGVGASAHDHNVGASFKALDDSGFINTMDTVSNLTITTPSDVTSQISTADIQTLIDGKNIIIDMNGNALEISPQGYLAAKVGSFGMGVFASSDIVASAVVDQTHDQLIFNSGSYYYKISDAGTASVSTVSDYNNYSIEYAINNGLTYVQLQAIVVGEVPVAYGYDFQLSGGDLMVGGALKYMQGYTYTETMKIDNSGTTANNVKHDKTTSTAGVDLGLAFQPSFDRDLTLGLVAKNLNSPEFKFSDGTKAVIDPLVRAGVAYNIFESLEVALDVDLTKNKTLVSEVDSQMVGGGFDYHPATWFNMRLGAMQNLDSADTAGTIYTAGLGIGPRWLQLDISGQMASKTTTVNGTSYPEYAKVNLALISRW